VGQITPHTFPDALALIPKLAAQLVARLGSMQHRLPPSSSDGSHAAAAAEECMSALQQLLQHELPVQLQQYTEQMQQAAAAAAAVQVEAAATAGNAGTTAQGASTADVDFDIADLLGLGPEHMVLDEPTVLAAQHSSVGAGVSSLVADLQTDDDLTAAAAAAASYAPDLHQAVELRQQQQQQAFEASPQGPDTPWVDEFELLFGTSPDMHGTAAAPDDSLLPGWTDMAAAAAAALQPVGTPHAAAAGCAEDDDDVFGMLFGAAGTNLSRVQAGDQDPPSPDAAAEPAHPQGLQAVSAQGGSSAAAVAPASSGAEAADAGAASTQAAAAAGEAQQYSLDDFIASLSLEDQSQVLLPPPAGSSCRQSAVLLPEGLKFVVQQVLNLLEDLVGLYNSSHSTKQTVGDAAAAQMLHKLKVLWEQLSRSGVNTSDPVFVYKGGPVTRAAKLGCSLLLEDFNR